MGNGTSIGKVRGLGSAHSGAHHWLIQRFTAIGNLVLMSWALTSCVLLPDFSYETVTTYLAQPVPAVAMSLLILSLFWHAKLGLQVLIEDYVGSAGARFGWMAVLNLASFGGGAFGIFCVLKAAFGGAM